MEPSLFNPNQNAPPPARVYITQYTMYESIPPQYSFLQLTDWVEAVFDNALKEVANKYLSVPGSLVPSEEVSNVPSASSIITNKKINKRNGIKPKLIIINYH